MFRASSYLALIVTLALALGACGGSESQPQGDKLGSSDAKVVQKSTTDAVKTVVVDHLIADLSKLAAGDPAALIGGIPSDLDIDGMIPSDLGGNFGLSGTGKALGDLGSLGDLSSLGDLGLLGGDLGQLPGFDFDLKGRFEQWKTSSGAILDGALDLDIEVVSALPMQIKVRVKGLIDVSGSVQGKADIDLSIDFGANGLPDVCGLVGGQGFDLDGCTAGQGGLPDVPGVPSDLPGLGKDSAPLVGDALAATMLALQTKLAADIAVARAGMPIDIPGLPGGVPGSDQLPAGAGWLSGSYDDVKVDGELPGAAGGKVSVSGSGSVDADGGELSVELGLSGYSVSGMALTGSLSATISVDINGTVSATLTGTLSFTGATAAATNVSVDLDIDLGGASPSICGLVGEYPLAQGSCE
jgi:hypothetical protein